jgi:monofunctional biosynthetic peptidoglycan transglycosylase
MELAFRLVALFPLPLALDYANPMARASTGRKGEPRRKAGGGNRSRKARVRWRRVLLVALLCAGAVAAAAWASLPSAGPLRDEAPATTALIETRAQQARDKGQAARRVQSWVPLRRISPWLQKAVVASEDARFFAHDGVDAVEAGEALRGRGASTITQQLAKNLWLGEERTLWRKLKEVLLARRLEALGKERILELYLNVVEWGPGLYGAEAAARTWFKKPAAELLPEEAAVLAAMLPAPRARNPRRPSLRLRARAAEVLELYGLYQQLSPAELAEARERLRRLLPVPP